MPPDIAGDVADVLETDAADFQAEAAADGEVVKSELREGTFDNHQAIVGLEYEFYAVSDGRWTESDAGRYPLTRVPRRLLELIGFEKELGFHNAEMSTSPQPLNPHGLQAQESEVLGRLSAALDVTDAEGMRLVSDGMWTIPPAGETAKEYLTDSVAVDGIRVATNMSKSVRYHAMANGPNAPDTFTLEAPHVTLDAETVMPESLITSVQPHYQVPLAEDIPGRFNYTLRIAGPLLALGVNSPFFPPDLYDADATAREVVEDGWDGHRILVFESVLNSYPGADKVRFPRDLYSLEDAVDRVVDDATMVPIPVRRGDRFDDTFATLRTKHGTYWRWVRPVFDGATRGSANARIEFRPVAAQPTVRDTIAVQATFAGLLESLPRHEHPVTELDWDLAEENFYAAAKDGLDADFHWITNDGRETTDADELFEELFAHAVDGLTGAGCTREQAERYVAPLRRRAETGVTPAAWKRAQVVERLDDGDDLDAAIEGMQRAYIDQQKETLLDGSFADWPGVSG